MSHPIKVKRSGIERIFRKTPLREWMDEQPTAELTYTKEFSKKLDKRDKGWTTENFVREAWHRGVDLRIGTLLKWTSGSHPRVIAAQAVRNAFPTIKF